MLKENNLTEFWHKATLLLYVRHSKHLTIPPVYNNNIEIKLVVFNGCLLWSKMLYSKMPVKFNVLKKMFFLIQCHVLTDDSHLLAVIVKQQRKNLFLKFELLCILDKQTIQVR